MYAAQGSGHNWHVGWRSLTACTCFSGQPLPIHWLQTFNMLLMVCYWSAGLHYYQSGQGELLLCLYLRRLLNLLLHAASAGPAGHAASNSTGLGYPGGISSCCWTEAHATLLKSLVDTCSQVVSMQLDQVIVALKVAAQQPALSKGTAFGQMLMALVKQYAAVLTAQQISGLQAAASATNTFLTRSLVNKLQQLAQQQ